MIHNFCKKCQWHQIRKGSSTNIWEGTITHNVDIDACIHPILDKTGRVNPVSGRNELRVTKCSERNAELNCQHFQPALGFFGIILAQLRGRSLMSQIYEDYQQRHPSRLEKPGA